MRTTPDDRGRPYEVVDLVQGTAAWLDWRGRGIGASDAPAVLGENPWKSRAWLLREKLGGARGRPNERMARGTALEPVARARYVARTGRAVRPACLQSRAVEWLRASVDGLSDDHRHVVEIKCGERVHEHAAATGEVPRHYVGQLQHILAVTGLDAIDFYCHLPGRPDVHIAVPRDPRYIERLLALEERFWQELETARRESPVRG